MFWTLPRGCDRAETVFDQSGERTNGFAVVRAFSGERLGHFDRFTRFG